MVVMQKLTVSFITFLTHFSKMLCLFVTNSSLWLAGVGSRLNFGHFSETLYVVRIAAFYFSRIPDEMLIYLNLLRQRC